MKTPITDAKREVWLTCKPNCELGDGRPISGNVVDVEIARRLELDRAALLEFAIRVRNTTSSTRIKREATAVIAEARANFPD